MLSRNAEGIGTMRHHLRKRPGVTSSPLIGISGGDDKVRPAGEQAVHGRRDEQRQQRRRRESADDHGRQRTLHPGAYTSGGKQGVNAKHRRQGRHEHWTQTGQSPFEHSLAHGHASLDALVDGVHHDHAIEYRDAEPCNEANEARHRELPDRITCDL